MIFPCDEVLRSLKILKALKLTCFSFGCFKVFMVKKYVLFKGVANYQIISYWFDFKTIVPLQDLGRNCWELVDHFKYGKWEYLPDQTLR